MEEKIITFLKCNYGYIRTKDFENMGISRVYISTFINSRLIRKVGHGIYIDNNLIEDEYYILQLTNSDVYFSYNTAFHLLNLSPRPPYKIDVTLANNKRIRGNYEKHYIIPQKLHIGGIEIISPYGNPIRVYNTERSICDMLKNEKEFDLELRNRILNAYFNSKDKNLKLLDEYGKIFGVSKKLNIIIEVMMKW